MNIKLIATDLDNTLLRRDKTISDYTVSVLKRLRERGVMLAFATSRSEFASQRFTNRIVPDIFVSNGGSLARRGEITLYSDPIPQSSVDTIIAACFSGTGIHQITVEAANGYFNSEPIDPSWSGWEDYSHSRKVDFREHIDYGDVYKIVVLAANPASVNAIICCDESLSVQQFTGEDWHQIKRRDVNKARALRAVVKHMNISLADVAAFGDDLNDIEMLRECGIGVAVSNALDEVKAVAGCICGDCDDDGVACWLEENLL